MLRNTAQMTPETSAIRSAARREIGSYEEGLERLQAARPALRLNLAQEQFVRDFMRSCS